MERMAIELHRVASPSDPAFAAAVEVLQADDDERNPGDPAQTPGSAAAELFSTDPDHPGMLYVATVADEPAGFGQAQTHSAPDDELQLGEIEISIVPRHRSRGVATALADVLIPALAELGQNSLIAYPCAEITPEAGVALCQRYGLTRRQEERCSRARVTDIDEALLDTWIGDAATAAPGYRIEQWEGVCPDDLADAWARAEAAMDDAPLDDVEYHRHSRAAEAQRAADEARRASGYRIYRSLVLGPDGDAAGLSALHVHVDRPEVGHQGDTGVLAAHRGHRIGKWLKAANYRHTRAHHPELSVIETYNAQTNPWMLDINVAMGFRPHHVYTAYQGPLDDALDAVRLAAGR